MHKSILLSITQTAADKTGKSFLQKLVTCHIYV